MVDFAWQVLRTRAATMERAAAAVTERAAAAASGKGRRAGWAPRTSRPLCSAVPPPPPQQRIKRASAGCLPGNATSGGSRAMSASECACTASTMPSRYICLFPLFIMRAEHNKCASLNYTLQPHRIHRAANFKETQSCHSPCLCDFPVADLNFVNRMRLKNSETVFPCGQFVSRINSCALRGAHRPWHDALFCSQS